MLDAMWDAAVLLSAQGPHLIETQTPVPADLLHRYWSLSQARTRHWGSLLRPHIGTATRLQPLTDGHLELAEQTLHAVFCSEVFTRLAGTLLEASDLRRGVRDAGPIARNVFLAHLEVRQMALQLLVSQSHLPSDRIANLDTLRRRSERWSDVLTGHLVVRYGVTGYAFEVERARDFGSEQLRTATSPRQNQAIWDLYRLSLRSAFEPYTSLTTRDEQFRQSLVAALLGWLPQSLFADSGVMQSAWVARFTRSLQTQDRAVSENGSISGTRTWRRHTQVYDEPQGSS